MLERHDAGILRHQRAGMALIGARVSRRRARMCLNCDCAKGCPFPDTYPQPTLSPSLSPSLLLTWRCITEGYNREQISGHRTPGAASRDRVCEVGGRAADYPLVFP